MKTLHLVCNAHLDPVWMWDWHEGAAEALATYYSAVELAGEYDYIFCHNEVLIYQYVERFAPKLFADIQELARQGKWHIMGGWYLQPDCNLPSGEAFIRQATLGREYFGEKFNSRPTVAVNFDSFGHTRGLPQILRKCGYDGYICCRPMPDMMELPDVPFLWKGYDGSTVKVLRTEDEALYCTKLGEAKADILRKSKVFENEETGLVLWGVGNHGGGPSRKDLSDILCLRDEKKGEYEVIHSTPEAYFAQIEPKVTVETPLPCFVKSYTSISHIKQAYANLEDRLYEAERACAVAELAGKYTCDREVFHKAEEAMSAFAFHDVLSGTCTEEGEKSSIRKADCAVEQLRQEFLNAFFALAADYETAPAYVNPFVVFNFQPYGYTQVVETEMLIPRPLVSDEKAYKLTVWQNGKQIPAQIIKENSNINYDRRKRLAYLCEMNPLGVSRVDVVYELAQKQPKFQDAGGDILITDAVKTVHINRATGLLDSFVVNGKEYLSGGAFAPVMFADTEDPWGFKMFSLGKDYRDFSLSPCDKGMFAGLQAVKITEQGDVLTQVESLFELNTSTVVLRYKIYRDLPYVDVTVEVLWNEQSQGLKLRIPSVEAGSYFGQVAYGTEEYAPNGTENVAQRFVGVGEEDCLAVYSSGVYGNSKQGKDLYLTLLNGSAYCAHPVDGRPLVDSSRLVDYIERGNHRFKFRMGVNPKASCERLSQEFAYTPHSVNMYPHGDGNIVKDFVVVDSPDVVVTAFKKRKNGGWIVRLFNNSAACNSTQVRVGEHKAQVELEAFTFETYIYTEDGLEKCADASIY